MNDSALHPDGLPKPARGQRRDGSKGRRDVAERPAGPPQPGALKDLDPWREALGAPHIRVAVEASDPITASGLSTHLSRHPNIDFVSGADDAATVEVHVLCVDRVDAAAGRRGDAQGARTTRAPLKPTGPVGPGCGRMAS